MTAPIKMESPLGARMFIGGREVDYYCGTSYFCLHGHSEVIEAACEATRRYGMGPGTLAHMQVYADLQERLRDWFGTEEVVYMISGYTSPMVLLQGLRDEFDVILMDSATHYSTRDAIPTLGKRVHEFRHADPEDLAAQLSLYVKAGERPAVLTDGVFPSSGRLAPLGDYRQAMAPYDGALLCIDDSHGVGVLGETGRGSLQHAGLEGEGNYLAGTMSKAFAFAGGQSGEGVVDEGEARRVTAVVRHAVELAVQRTPARREPRRDRLRTRAEQGDRPFAALHDRLEEAGLAFDADEHENRVERDARQ